MSKKDNLKEYLQDLYEGIQSKVPDASRDPQTFRTTIEGIQSGTSLDPLTNPATTDHIWYGKETYDDKGEKIVGSVPYNGDVSQVIDGINTDNVVIPSGITSGGTVSLTTDIQDEVDIQEDLIDEIISIVNNKMAGSDDMLQQVVDTQGSCSNLFYRYSGTTLDFIVNLNTSNVNDMSNMFYYCTNLTTIPELNTSNVTNMSNMFNQCTNLTTIPALDTSKVTSMSNMFYQCSKLTTIPELNTSNVNNMGGMFYYCTNLTTIPLLYTSKVTNMGNMFYECSKLTTIPELNTSKVTHMSNMFYHCANLTTIPLLNTSNVNNMSYMFYRCTNLTTIPELNTSNVTNMSNMFNQCTNLTTIPALDTSKVTSMDKMFSYCASLKTILMTGMKVSFDISASTKFERSDLVTILNNLATVTSTQTLTMGATNLAKLTEEDKAIATNKGWTLK